MPGVAPPAGKLLATPLWVLWIVIHLCWAPFALLFATFLAHLGAALFRGLVRRDGVFESMAPWRQVRGHSAESVSRVGS